MHKLVLKGRLAACCATQLTFRCDRFCFLRPCYKVFLGHDPDIEFFSRCNATTWTMLIMTWTTIKLSTSSLQLKIFTRTCFSEVLTCTSPQVLCLVRGLSNSGPLCLRANYWPQCPGLSALGTWHYFYYQVAKGLKLLCDHVSAGEKSLKLPSSGAKSVLPPPLLWVEAIVHLKSRN